MNVIRKIRYPLLAVLLMTVGSMTSLLYPLHVGVDQNCFLTVAREICKGKMLYRDIFEQKGPLLYLLHLPAALMPGLRFFGVYLVQILLWCGILYAASRLCKILMPGADENTRFAVSAWSALIIVTAFCYSLGDNAEELCLLPVMLSLGDLLTAAKSERLTFSRRLLLKNGVFAGCVLLIKFSMLGFYIGWCICIGLWLWRDCGFLSALRAALWFLIGMAAVCLPFVLYFAYHHALSDAVGVYIITNATGYPRHVTLWQRIADFFAKDILWNPVMMAAVLLGAGYTIYIGKRRERTGLLSALCLLYLFVFIGGVRYRYYLLILGAFVPVGVCAAMTLWGGKLRRLKKAGLVLYPVILLLAGNPSLYLTKPRAFYPQVQLAEMIEPGSVLLNYGFLDGGFWLMSGAELPTGRFFCKLNIDRAHLPEMYEAQERCIDEREADYVVIRWEPDEDPAEKYSYAPFYEHYEPVADAENPIAGYCYRLYRRAASSEV